MKNSIPESVIEANKYVHATLANMGEYTKSPHFFLENQEKVRKIILGIIDQYALNSQKSKMLDFGCGTGFIINLTKDLFQEVHGIDITQEMLKLVDTNSGNIFLKEGFAEDTKYPTEYFDFASAYSFMDHLYDYKIFLREAYRVLKKGGVFYSDLNPNTKFSKKIFEISTYNPSMLQSTNIQKEIKGTLHNGDFYYENFGISSEILEAAEPIKTKDLGFDMYEVIAFAKDLGFKECIGEYDWFMDEGKLLHSSDPTNRTLVDNYLRSILPVSENLYKYIRFIFIK